MRLLIKYVVLIVLAFNLLIAPIVVTLLGGKHVLLPIPKYGRSFTYELRVRRYLLRDPFAWYRYVFRDLGFISFSDQLVNLSEHFPIDPVTGDTSQIPNESLRKEVEKVGTCYLDGKYGSWRISITSKSLVSLFDRGNLEGNYACRSDQETYYIFDY